MRSFEKLSRDFFRFALAHGKSLPKQRDAVLRNVADKRRPDFNLLLQVFRTEHNGRQVDALFDQRISHVVSHTIILFARYFLHDHQNVHV